VYASPVALKLALHAEGPRFAREVQLLLKAFARSDLMKRSGAKLVNDLISRRRFGRAPLSPRT
jgi:hypothetical protein